jgi:hypothetical protein
MSQRMLVRFTFSLTLALTFAGSVTKTRAQVSPPASGVYCNFNIPYTVPDLREFHGRHFLSRCRVRAQHLPL